MSNDAEERGTGARPNQVELVRHEPNGIARSVITIDTAKTLASLADAPEGDRTIDLVAVEVGAACELVPPNSALYWYLQWFKKDQLRQREEFKRRVAAYLADMRQGDLQPEITRRGDVQHDAHVDEYRNVMALRQAAE